MPPYLKLTKMQMLHVDQTNHVNQHVFIKYKLLYVAKTLKNQENVVSSGRIIN